MPLQIAIQWTKLQISLLLFGLIMILYKFSINGAICNTVYQISSKYIIYLQVHTYVYVTQYLARLQVGWKPSFQPRNIQFFFSSWYICRENTCKVTSLLSINSLFTSHLKLTCQSIFLIWKILYVILRSESCFERVKSKENVWTIIRSV